MNAIRKVATVSVLGAIALGAALTVAPSEKADALFYNPYTRKCVTTPCPQPPPPPPPRPQPVPRKPFPTPTTWR